MDISRECQLCLVIQHGRVGAHCECYCRTFVVAALNEEYLVLVHVFEDKTEVVGIQAVHHSHTCVASDVEGIWNPLAGDMNAEFSIFTLRHLYFGIRELHFERQRLLKFLRIVDDSLCRLLGEVRKEY